MVKPARKESHWLIYAMLVAVVFAIYWQAAGFEFLNMDDTYYVRDNPTVLKGLTTDSIRWAFTTDWQGNWHPLTWLSLMLDSSISRAIEPPGDTRSASVYHVTNVVLHTLNTLLLYVILFRMTRRRWASAFVALAFAVHPVHVESVAWVTERKDVLSTFFWMLATLAYVRWVNRPRWWKYLLVVAAYTLGLMTKAMLVTLPITLLLLDYWPLGRRLQVTGYRLQEGKGSGRLQVTGDRLQVAGDRLQEGKGAFSARRLIWEKVPLFLVAAASTVVTSLAATPALGSLREYTVGIRLANAAVSYVSYILKTLWPAGLAAFYPHPGRTLSLWQIALSVLLLVTVTILTIRAGRKKPYLMVGWLWYVVTLVPVIGIVQVGGQGSADRYMYVPMIGLLVAAAWGIPELVGWLGGRLSFGPRLLPYLAGTVIAALGVVACVQTSRWESSKSLFTYALKVTRNNAMAHYSLGFWLEQNGDGQAARREYEETLRIRPELTHARISLGNMMMAEGDLDGAIGQARLAVRYQPSYGEGHYNLANFLMRKRKIDEAVKHYRAAIRFAPGLAGAYNNLGIVLALRGEKEEAERMFRQVLRLDPNSPQAHENVERFIRNSRRR